MTKHNIRSGGIRVNGLRMHYLTAGSTGSPVVLVGGYPQTTDAWRKMLPLLAEHHTVYAIDLPGLGHSDNPVDGYDTQTMAHRLHDAIAGLGLERYALVSHDIGTWVAVPYAALYRQEIHHLVLTEALVAGINVKEPVILETPADKAIFTFFLFHALQGVPEMLLAGREYEYVKWFITAQLADPTAIPDADIQTYAQAFAAPGGVRAGLAYYKAFFANAPANQELLRKKLPMPVLALDGEFGNPRPLIDSLGPFTENLSGGVIPGSGHFLPEEVPEAFADRILEFLAKS